MHRLWAACLLATLVLPLHSAPAYAATRGVSIADNSYSPTPVTINIADTVRWTNNGFSSHTSTGNAPLSYWSSGTLRRGSTYSRALPAAGTYGYFCAFHSSMRGTVRVRMGATPSSGSTSTTFTLTVAKASAPSGYEYVIRRRNPGGTFSTWRTITAATTTFRPSAGTGTYSFQTRLHRIGNDSYSGWSPIRNVSVS